MGHSETDIEAALLKIYRTLLGVEAKTATDGLRHELGIASQKVRAEAAALKFRHNILSLDPQDFLVRRVYDGLRGEGGYGTCACGVKYLEDLARNVEWPEESLSRGKAKELAKFVVEASQAVDFESCLARRMSTLRNYELWTDAERTDLPAYLKRRCPLGSLREGRRLKTKLRLGCHPLRSSAARMSITRNATCPCCGHGSETIMHTIFECPKLDDIRGVFLQKLETILPETRNMTNADCLALLMGDDPPQEIENLLYRFLTSLFRRRLGILAAQGEGL